MRVLVTGASGFIGGHVLPALRASGAEVFALTQTEPEPPKDGLSWHRADLLTAGEAEALCSSLKPTHLLHLAWYTEHGKFWQSQENYAWLQASLNLLQAFARHGGQRAVLIGTGFEYDPRYGYCVEGLTPLTYHQPYGASKAALSQLLPSLGKSLGLNLAWARLFLMYGPGENPRRLVPHVIHSLLQGQRAGCTYGSLVRDFLYVKDVASAMSTLLGQDLTGEINLASGVPISLADMVRAIGAQLGRSDLLDIGLADPPPSEPKMQVASVERLHGELGWRPVWNLESGLAETIAWCRARA